MDIREQTAEKGKWMPEPVSIQVGGNIDGNIVVGDHNFVVNTNHGTIVYQQSAPQVRARTFVSQPPRAPRGFVNRTAELARLEKSIAANEVILLHGPDGMGKSAILKQAANLAAARAMPGGVILLESVDVDGQALGPNDIVQRLFDALFESNPPLKVDVVSARTHLSNTRPLVLMDDLALAPALRNTLPDLFPQGAILLSADTPGGADFERLAIGPLPRSEALALLATRAELTLNDANRAALDKLCTLLGDVSLALVVTGNVLRETHTSPDAAVQAIEALPTPEREPALSALSRAFGLAFTRLSPREQQVLSAAALTPGISMTPEWLSAALGNIPVDEFIERLKALGLLFTNSPRLRLPPGFLAPAQRAATLEKETMMTRLVIFLTEPLRETPNNWAYIQDELGNFLGALNWAAQRGRLNDVITLTRALDPYLTLHGLWDVWGAALGYVLEAARQGGQRAVEAWALHQSGTRAIGMGERKQALDLLRAALEIRRGLGDNVGAAYTQHNIDILIVPPPPPGKPNPPQNNSGPNWPLLIGGTGLVGLIIFAGLIVLGWRLLQPPVTTPDVPPPPTATEIFPITETPNVAIQPTETETPLPANIPTTTDEPTATSTATPLGGGAGELVYQQGNDNPYLLARISSAGESLVPLLNNSYAPAWSPDGQRVAFSADESEIITIAYHPQPAPTYRQIYVLDVATGALQQITKNFGDKSNPDWSPNGQQIVFTTRDVNFNGDLFIVDAGGGEPFALTSTSEIDEDYPAWSPDGSQILYQANEFSYRHLFLLNADGSSNGDGEELPSPDELVRRNMIEPSWSPDGKRVTFAASMDGGETYDIYVMNRDGFKLQRITDERFSGSDERSPVWSPDGVWIAFTSSLNFPRQLFIIRNNGSKLSPLTTDLAAWEPDWRP